MYYCVKRKGKEEGDSHLIVCSTGVLLLNSAAIQYTTHKLREKGDTFGSCRSPYQ